MPVSEKEFKIGLMVTALLEDRYNKTGHMRSEASRAADVLRREHQGIFKKWLLSAPSHHHTGAYGSLNSTIKKADALLIMPGMAKQCKDFLAEKDAPLIIIRVNYAMHYVKAYEYKQGYNERLISVRQAVALGADIVVASLLFSGNDEANVRNINQFGEYVEEADSLGIPLLGEYIPMGSIDTFNDNIDRLLLGTRAVAEFGADLIKTVYVDRFDEITKTAGIPVFGLGGGKTDKPIDSFTIAKNVILKGAAGVIFGRNVICASDPVKYLDLLIDIVKFGKIPEEAAKEYSF